jgi:haloalkane dehalogenase
LYLQSAQGLNTPCRRRPPVLPVNAFNLTKKSAMTRRTERPFTVDPTEYPFADHWFEGRSAVLHYLDEGAGLPVVMLHGNPTWSFLYRKIIKAVNGQCRSIVPDYPGFGFSQHPPDYGYTPMEHARWIRALIDAIGLDRYVLIVQDWGGPIGLSIAVDQPDKVAGIVLCNSWCWPPFANALLFSYIMGGPLGKYLHLHHNFFARVMVPLGIYHRRAKTRSILKAYTDPFPTPESRIGTYVFPRQIRKASDWLKGIEGRLTVLRAKPVEMVWAKKDPAFGKEAYIKKWKTHFPDAPVDRIEDASHYIQEDAPERVASALVRILKRTE